MTRLIILAHLDNVASVHIRVLIRREARDVRSAEVLVFFCYQTKKRREWIGAYAAGLGGLDMLVFIGGLGDWKLLISTETGEVAVRIIPTDEQQMIARGVTRLLQRQWRQTGLSRVAAQ